MEQHPDILTYSETMQRIGMSPRQFSRSWRAMIIDKKFPAPLPGTGRRPKWVRSLVDAWIESNGGTVEASLPALKTLRADRQFEQALADMEEATHAAK